MTWLTRSLKAILILMVLFFILVYVGLNSSKPTLNGQIETPILVPATIERDKNGIATINSATREGVAYSLGFLHAQERFFQMDLLRKNSAGELSELFGKVALGFDSKIRLHQFRKRASQYLHNLPEQHKRILEHYTNGVNAGLKQLTLRPFEYLLLNKTPSKWASEDSLLVLYSMYIDLQYEFGEREQLLGILKDNLMGDVYDFLNPKGSRWDAPIDNTEMTASPIPKNSFQPVPIIDALAKTQQPQNLFDSPHEALSGSNSWVVAGTLTSSGAALLANDMHLGIRVPNIWYRAGFKYFNDQTKVEIDGVTLPGTPAMVVGSNRHVAWGFTNSYGDWSELIALKTTPDGSQYLTPEGYKSFGYESEIIQVKGQQEPRKINIKVTQWGPVVSQDSNGQQYALRWTAHDPEGINFNLLNLETVANTQSAIEVAHTMAIPAQNIVVADRYGDIAWTIAGPMPNKIANVDSPDWQTPQDWSNGDYKWLGYLAASKKPTVFNPKSNRIWTANSRIVGNEMLERIGNGGYALGARGQQIRDGLFARQIFSEQDFLDIQNDHRALFLDRWHDLILEKVLTESYVNEQNLHVALEHIKDWQQSASVDSVGYTIVEAFRRNVRQSLFDNLLSPIKKVNIRDLDIRPIRHQLETPMWALITEQPDHIMPKGFNNWTDFLQSQMLFTINELKEKYGTLANANWGNVNRTNIQHPLSKAIPALSWLLDMPSQEVTGDSYMPRVQGREFGASERFVVSPGNENSAILHMPSGQSAHPLSPYYGNGHNDWADGTATPLLPSKTKYKLILQPSLQD
ncbi:penicillin acylase family protein [Psychrosphaera aestuarii]|uniref:penicillin acylase family protein n=1 Tax=Psychrosphaera aestuarii TaxID=1266052 RepID=UPI001B333842|nr:penicillin acylase family protein [Psychrosphaera aestuarii]